LIQLFSILLIQLFSQVNVVSHRVIPAQDERPGTVTAGATSKPMWTMKNVKLCGLKEPSRCEFERQHTQRWLDYDTDAVAKAVGYTVDGTLNHQYYLAFRVPR
jgi:hypothetical protein